VPPYKFLGFDRLRFVTGRSQGFEVIVLSDNILGFGSDGAIAKLIIVRVIGNYGETELGIGPVNVAVKLREQFEKCRDIAPPLRPRKPLGDFLIFEQDFGGNGKAQPAIEQRAKNRVKRLSPSEDLEKNTRIQANRHE
jgi:hypothetical protein